MEFEVWPGPMEGIGKGGFITAVNDLKLIDRWMTPFVRLSQEVPRQGKLAAFYAGFKASGVPVCVQLMGVDPGLLAQAGEVFAGFGAESININFGCPSSRVISGGAGGGALKTPEKLADFCCEVRAGLPANVPLSVKIRCGWENCDEMEKFLPEIAASGAVDKIFFHCRTVKELYKPIEEKERYRRFRRAVELAGSVPVIINGDIDSVEKAHEAVEYSGGAGVMIARPWLRDPWLLRRFSDPSAPDAESGRERFFAAACAQNLPRGGIIELAKMLWGVNDPRFKALLNADRD